MLDKIVVRGARANNLKNIDVEIPRDKLVVMTGLSGSGKSSLAFDTIFADGQRRYMESLSSYARQFLGQMEKPDVDSIEGLSPAISIDQKTTSKNPRSTVGTVTEIYDYLRLLYARIGIPHCPVCGREIKQQSVDEIVDRILALEEGTRIQLLAPIVRGKKGQHLKALETAKKSGYVRVRIDGNQYDLSEQITLEKNKKHTIEIIVDRLVVKPTIRPRLTDSLETVLALTGGLAVVDVIGGEEMLFSQSYACPEHGVSVEELTPRMFSFNNPFGACPHCTGLGVFQEIDPKLVVPNRDLSIRQGAIKAVGWNSLDDNSIAMMYYQAISEKYGISLDVPVKELSKEQLNLFLYGTKEDPLFLHRTTAGGRTEGFRAPFEGVIPNLKRRFADGGEWAKEEISSVMSDVACPVCHGKRLKPEVLAVTVGDKNIIDLTELSVTKALDFFAQLQLTEREQFIAARIVKEIRERLGFLNNVGLEYLTLSRNAGTLSGGESQRIRLATQIGSYLMGVLYILDEPSIGLHQRDNDKLIDTLKRLRDLGNTLIVVEHDDDTILAADYVVDIGPGAREHNLKNIDVSIPLGVFTCVTGVSGSGKSSLVNEILYKYLAARLNRARTRHGDFDSMEGTEFLDKVIDIDQSPIGRTPRSNPATYTGVFTDIRELFAKTNDAKAKGYTAGRFSFNVKGGRCEACQGDGILRIEMHFLPDVYVPCEVCKGKRYNRETLAVEYKGKSIYDVLEMTVDEGVVFFENHPKIARKLKTLQEVGLGYLKIGQPATTLSGGEAQRVKLATELSKRPTGRTIYILDEPTTGLHTADVHRLIEVLQRLTDTGNTVVVIEHNLNVIKVADWIVDLGPEGGDRGGTVVVSGTPEQVAACADSYTGKYLKPYLEN